MEYKIIIPARGGSKRVPRKNIKQFCGKPLIEWTINYSFESGYRPHVLTDDPEIYQFSLNRGCYVLHEPTELADDATLMVDVFRYFHQFAGPCHIILLQTTYPYRRPGLIDECIKTFETESADTLYTAAPVNFYLVTREGVLVNHSYDTGKIPLSQYLEQQYLHAGSVGIIRSEIVQEMHTSIHGKYSLVEIPLLEALQDLDTMDDWERMSMIMPLLQSQSITHDPKGSGLAI